MNSATGSESNAVVKRVVLDVPLERVWAAITDSSRFGYWFGAEFDGPFVAGEVATGRIRPTQVDQETAALQEPMSGMPVTVYVDAIEAMVRFAFRWHPGPESDVLTRVSFELAPTEAGIAVTVTEEGFDELPDDVRSQRRENNAEGWEHQGRLLARYLELPA
ncbi:SRPBCC domain-containing protein [Parafrigoribacterium soli]|uniref:SRPBCC domain-containing protein n=1 Tax=Parafrigoribacterium soli TaxID=3144663 RepID=UPI0032EDE08E